jgi:hypothetical protein
MNLPEIINANQHPLDLLGEVVDKLNALLKAEKTGLAVRTTFYALRMDQGINNADFSIELIKTLDSDIDDDLNEPLGTPSCNLGEDCESCQ